MARKALRMARGMDMLVGVVRDGSSGGTAGRPAKEDDVAEDCLVSDALDIRSE